MCDNVLHNRHLDKAGERPLALARLEAIAHGMHTGEGLGEQRRSPQRFATADEIERLLRLFADLDGRYEEGQVGSIAWREDLLTRLGQGLDRERVMANPAPAVLVAEALELCLAKGYAVPDGLAQGFRQTCLDAIADAIEVKARQTLGLCLGRLGDPRPASLRDPAAYIEVPAGAYVYGDNNEKLRIATPFRLGRYLVTNGQYAAFMADGGYRNRACWSDEGWAWLQQEGVAEPRYWQDRRWNIPNQPVIGVSFWEADACCRWAGGRLPTEQEWEAAARGTEGYQYPWGNDWEDGICSSDSAGLGVTSPVGLFPRARQAQLGFEDLAGNCWEWCDGLWDKPGAGAPRVLRGGTFDVWAQGLRASFRFGGEPEDRVRYIGFRCVLAPPRQP